MDLKENAQTRQFSCYQFTRDYENSTAFFALLQEARRLVAAQLQNIVYRVVLKLSYFHAPTFFSKYKSSLITKIFRSLIAGSGCLSFWDPKRCPTSPWTSGIRASTCPTYLPTSSTPSPPLHLGQLRLSSSLGTWNPPYVSDN